MISNTKKNRITFLNVDGTKKMDLFLIGNHFNKFFLHHLQKNEDKIVKVNKYFSDFLIDLLQSNFFLIPTLPDEIQGIPKGLIIKNL